LQQTSERCPHTHTHTHIQARKYLWGLVLNTQLWGRGSYDCEANPGVSL
jgi:hypothetical protein